MNQSPPTGFGYSDPKTGFKCHSWSFNAAVAMWYEECQKRKRPISWEEAQDQIEKYVCEQLIKAPGWENWIRFDEREPYNFFEQNCSAIICVYKPDIEKLNKCLTAVFPQVKEVILVADGYVPKGVVEHKKIKPFTIYPESGYSKKANLGACHATTEYLWFLNDDCYPFPDCAERLMEVTTLNPKIGMVGHLLEYPDGKIQHGGTVRSPDGIGFTHIKDNRIKDTIETEAVTGASVMVRRDAFQAVKGFDESYFLYLEDSDLCMKLRRDGFKVYYTPYAKAIHEEGQSTSRTKNLDIIIRSSAAIFQSHWHDYFLKPSPSFVSEPKKLISIDVLYVHVVGDRKYEQFARRFVDSVRKYPPGHLVNWVIICNSVGPKLSAQMQNLFSILGKVTYFNHDNTGWDIGAYQAYARISKANLCVFLGGSSYCRRPNWILPMIKAFNRYGENAIYGTCGHMGAINMKVWPHIRTTGFFCAPATLNKYPNRIRTTQDRYPFEHGVNSLTQWALRQSLPVFVVDAEGEWKYPMWAMSRNGYHSRDQSALLMGDRITMSPYWPCP